MQHCDTLISARWCVPVEPADAVLEEHALIVSNGRIVDLLPLAEARARYQPSVLIERPDHVLIPGLVNAHTHAAMTLMRGLGGDLPLETWLRHAIWPVERRWVSAEMVRDGTELAIAEMIQAGITCFSDQYFFPEIVAQTAVDRGMRCMVGTPVVDVATAWAEDAGDYLQKGADLVHDPYSNHPLIATCYAPHTVAALSDETFVELRVLADQLDVPVQIHLHETIAEIDASIRAGGRRPCERLASLGLVNSSLMAVHAVHLSDDEIAMFARAGVSISHCPSSNLKLGSGIAPVAQYRARGINVAIGTDSAASNNVLDLLGEIRLAALLAKVIATDTAAISAAEALRMGTLDGARALGLGDVTGSLVTGKAADITCVDLGRLRSQPVYDVMSQIVYTASAAQVSDVWIAGRHQLENGRLNYMDTNELLSRSDEWRERLASTTQG
jgi:5-methylthioadenosine/S-adenosylhomocysteine deaminase